MDVNNIKDIQKLFEANRNSENAKKMAAYMKNKFPFMGIPSPLRNVLFRELQNEFGKIDIHVKRSPKVCTKK
jgi:3-methyladenine DNA glycosylase AlkD